MVGMVFDDERPDYLLQAKIEHFNFEVVCRICNQHNSNELYNINEEIDDIGMKIVDCINYCISFKIETEDEYPFSVCQICYDNLITLYKFKKKLVDSKTKLRAYKFSEAPSKNILFHDKCTPPKLLNNKALLEDDTFVNCKSSSLKANYKNLKKLDILKHRRDTSTDDQCNEMSVKQPEFVHTNPSTDDTQHLCSFCGKTFKYSFSLSGHMRLHTGETPYKCNICNKSFSHSGNMRIHIRGHNNDKRFNCNYCNKTFLTSSHLNVHQRSHSGTKPYKCMICKKAFNRYSHLQDHILIHTGEKPHCCDICFKTYKQSSHLYRHMKSHKLTMDKSLNDSKLTDKSC